MGRRRPWRWLSATLMAVMLAGAGTAVASRVLGVRMLVEHSDSMAPAIVTGDLVLARDVPAERARPGDIVSFPDPGGSGQLITHRVESIRRSGTILVFTTRGDANPAPEQWTALTGTTIGRTVGVVPAAGRIVAPVREPVVAAVLNGALVTLLALLVLDAVAGRRSAGRRGASPESLRRRRSPAARAPR